MIPRTVTLLAALVVAGCDASLADRDAPDLVQNLAEAPAGAAPGTCWGKVVTPAVIETVSDKVLLPPPEGPAGSAVTAPGTYRTETRQAIVQKRKVTWFETPCPADLEIAEFVSSLQRALAARNLYDGSVSGKMDARTRAAIRRFQRRDGLDSDVLSMAAARKLGLVAVEMPEDDTPEAARPLSDQAGRAPVTPSVNR
ncbi:MAG TPA: peptidoglycan-binding domain-containing protein [Roseovarius sp.]